MSPARPSASPTSPFRFFHVTVAAVRDVTPSMRRFTFIGDDLVHYADPGWDQRIKLVLPAPASGYEQLPDGEDWYGRLMKLPEEHRCSIRTYTTRTVRHEAEGPGGTRAEVDVDMVVHDRSARPRGGSLRPRSVPRRSCWDRTGSGTATPGAWTSCHRG